MLENFWRNDGVKTTLGFVVGQLLNGCVSKMAFSTTLVPISWLTVNFLKEDIAGLQSNHLSTACELKCWQSGQNKSIKI